ncbi:putative neural-cadherin 2 isoform X2 [Portunus trituberculatus]|uniref:putative neural-cadherin 2 isoform X2 n=1 Tax=Portunus trituberculatus TaxID=210409 RepID=UPI001E1CE943|nr:putative neural-cadherin 2 isoform X2 [Portunus trituberculatus]
MQRASCPGTPLGPLAFTQARYCVVVAEDAVPSSSLASVRAVHKQGAEVRYTLKQGNKEGLFSVGHSSGIISLAAPLDYEAQSKHEFVVLGEGGGSAAHALVRVVVADVNDNPPVFVRPRPHVTVIEEDDRDLPLPLAKVEANDIDKVDTGSLLYTISGDGVDGYASSDAYFTVDPNSGEVIQRKALDRDPPTGRTVWRVKVTVRDGQMGAWQERDEEEDGRYYSPPSHDPSRRLHRASGKGLEGVAVGGEPDTALVVIEAGETMAPVSDADAKRHNSNGVLRRMKRSSRISCSGSSSCCSSSGSGSSSSLCSSNHDIELPLHLRSTSNITTTTMTATTTFATVTTTATTTATSTLISLDRKERAAVHEISETERVLSLTRGGEKEGPQGGNLRAEIQWEVQSHLPYYDEVESRRWRRKRRRRKVDRENWLRRESEDEKREKIERQGRGQGGVGGDMLLDSPARQHRNSALTTHANTITTSIGGSHTTDVFKWPQPSPLQLPVAPSGRQFLLDVAKPVVARHAAEDVPLSSLFFPSFGTRERAKRGQGIGRKKREVNDIILLGSRRPAGDGRGKNVSVVGAARYLAHALKNDRSIVNDGPGGRAERDPNEAATIAITNLNSTASAFLPPSSPCSSSAFIFPAAERRRFLRPNSTSFPSISSAITFSARRKKAAGTGGVKGKSGRLIYGVFNASPRLLIRVPAASRDKRRLNENVHPDALRRPRSMVLHSPHASRASLHQPYISKLRMRLPNPVVNPRQQRRGKREAAAWKIYRHRQVLGTQETLRNVEREEPPAAERGKAEGREDVQLPTSDTEDLLVMLPRFAPTETDLPSTFTSLSFPSSSVASTASSSPNTRSSSSSSSSVAPSSFPSSSPFTLQMPLAGKKRPAIERPSLENTSEQPVKPRRPARREQRDLETTFHTNYKEEEEEEEDDRNGYGECIYFTPSLTTSRQPPTVTPEGGSEGETGGGRAQHKAETVLTVMVKDINDNAPVFPNTTIYGQVQENGAANLSVAVVSAWDADDATEGTNAKLTYSIEKNVIDERTGEAIFAVHPETGLVRTALCCLDRETTPEYHIQVVATDGGGQKGTGTVVIRLSDVNDNSPRLARKQWDLTVQETWGDKEPENTTLLEIAAADRDTANHFYYRVVDESGWGWEHFKIRTVGAVGQLYPVRTLDYEDERHRRGFKFMVQVTDRGRGGWTDPRHLDTAWISVKLTDVNDNPPAFPRPHAHVTVREDAVPGTLLATLPARDPDMAGQQKVDYWVEGGWGALKVDEKGSVTLWRALDREAPGGASGEALVVAVDRGRPPLTATATLSLTVTDVNDCPPTLLPPTVFHVMEDAPPTLLGTLKATDEDVWALGHGPPFNLSLATTNPAHVLESLSLKFDPRLDSGRGGAELWTVGGLDREAWAALKVDVVVVDAGGLTATHTLTVVVDDLNDHPMKPAAKTVYLWKTQGGGSEAPLGRVYVDDPDDWDTEDKSYAWDGPSHHLFSLHPRQGTIFASSVVREGRYSLRFRVSDRAWGQRDVAANVTVVVRELSQDALTHATPITLTPTTPTRLTKGWTPSGGGGVLGRLLKEVLKVVGGKGTFNQNKVEVVSVYGSHSPYHHSHQHPHSSHPLYPITSQQQQQHRRPHHSYHHYYYYYNYNHSRTNGKKSSGDFAGSSDEDEGGSADDIVVTERVESKDKEEGDGELPPPPPSACVWLSVVNSNGVFMNPTKLQGLLGLHVRQLEEATRLRVDLESPEEAGRRLKDAETPPPLSNHQPGEPSSAASLASTALPLQVVDTNITSLVTPRLTRALSCRAHEPETCTPSSCLNGGRCLPHPAGNRCVCPGGAEGWQCKVLARTFLGSGWAWVPPIPRCLPTTISLRILTRHPHALLLYAGPMAPTQRPDDTAPTPMLALQLRHGRPQLLVEGGLEPIKVEVNVTLTDGEWHDLHLHLDGKGVALMVDRCGRGWKEHADHAPAHCTGRVSWVSPWDLEAWPGSVPLQVAGLAHSPPTADQHRWGEAPIPRPFHGCLSHLTLNGQLVDLGQPAHSGGSAPGCRPQEEACPGGVGSCGYRGACVGGLNQPECMCQPGWAGIECATPTQPATLGEGSYMRVALSFTPPPTALSLQARIRVPRAASGTLVHVAAQHNTAAFTMHLRSGIVCASLTSAGMGVREACVEGRSVGDGAWHTVFGERHGDNLLVGVDDGDGWRRNESLPSLWAWSGHARGRLRGGPDLSPPFPQPVALLVDKHEGVTVGGLPKLMGVKVMGVAEDLTEACIDDVRVSGRQLPLPPAANGTSWGQVTTARHLAAGCVTPDPCINTTCPAPLTCTATPTWDQTACSCGSGRRQVERHCEDVDECLWRPCLHGGTCTNLRPGYLCLCGPAHAGDNCQWNTHARPPSALTAPAALAALTVSLVVLLILAVVVSLRLHRHRGNLCVRAPAGEEVEGGTKGTLVEMKPGGRGGRGRDDPGGGGGGGKGKGKLAMKEDASQEKFLVRLRLKLQSRGALSSKALKERDKASLGSSSSSSRRGSSGIGRGGVTPPPVTPVMVTPNQTPDLARDDLRAYAYEGDGSSSGSLTSTISGQLESSRWRSAPGKRERRAAPDPPPSSSFQGSSR